MVEKQPAAGYKMLRGQRNYWRLFWAGPVSRVGDSIDAIAYTWLVYSLTGSASWSALTLGFNALPSVLLAPLAAPLVEKLNKKRVMVYADLARAVILAMIAGLYLAELLAPWMLLAATFLTSCVEALREPAGTAAYPHIVPKALYAPAMALTSTASRIAELGGLALAGGVISLLGPGGALLIDGASFVFSAAVISTLRIQEQPTEQPVSPVSTYFTDLKEGFGYLGSQPVVLSICVLAAMLNLLVTPLNALNAAYVDLLGRGSEMLSLISMSTILGMLLGSTLFPKVQVRLSRGRMLQGGIFIVGFLHGMMVLILSVNHPWLQAAMLALSLLVAGIAISFMNMAVQVSFMERVDPAYLARTSSTMSAGCMALIPLGSFGMAALTNFVSVPTFLSFFCGLIVLMGLASLKVKTLKQL